MARKILLAANGLFLLIGLAACGPSAAPHRAATIGAAGPSAGSVRRAERAARLSPILTAAARILGLSQAELASRLKAGATLEELAAARHVPAARLEEALLAAERARLDALVRSHRLDEPAEARIFRRFQAGLPRLVGRPFGSGAGTGRPAFSGTGSAGAPS